MNNREKIVAEGERHRKAHPAGVPKTCTRCAFTWSSTINKPPARCPQCTSRMWNKPLKDPAKCRHIFHCASCGENRYSKVNQ